MRVIKVGGNQVDDPNWVGELARAVARSSRPTVLVHGGGREISALQRALGAEPEWRDGLRVTGTEGMRIVSMVLSGLVNKRLVAALLGAGVDALGISGEDGGLLRARPAHGGALGRTGEIVEVRAALLREWLAQGLTPVLSPVSRGPAGEPLNVNADDAAGAVAIAIGAAELLLVSDVVGVRCGERVLSEIDSTETEVLIASGGAAGGMVPKLRAAAHAATVVERVRIGSVAMLTDPTMGTSVRGFHMLAPAS